MSPTMKWYQEFMEFNRNWDNYTLEEKEIINNDFKERLYQLGSKRLEI